MKDLNRVFLGGFLKSLHNKDKLRSCFGHRRVTGRILHDLVSPWFNNIVVTTVSLRGPYDDGSIAQQQLPTAPCG